MKKPIPPRSVVALKKLWPHARKRGHEIGETRRIGYYNRQDGLDCVSKGSWMPLAYAYANPRAFFIAAGFNRTCGG
jgi:hypothetical protein